MQKISSLISENRRNFIIYNISRFREMIRYMPPQKLRLFKEIPFLIHANDPAFPGYVKNLESPLGIWNFEVSGLAEDLAGGDTRIKTLLQARVTNPAVEALYHIGSLGTFTQSEKSDFDFWVIVHPGNLDPGKMPCLQDKLERIRRYARESFSQEVTFFVHSAHNLRNDCIDAQEGTITGVPALLLKEEFYRTFLMIAGKIPLWAIEDPAMDPALQTVFREEALRQNDFIDLGSITTLPHEEIQKGLLWQICKSPEDPVKALIKGSITASYQVKKETAHSPVPICNQIRDNFKCCRVDDYEADPYVLSFNRAIAFHQNTSESLALAEIKTAIFLRLCGFPKVSLPAPGSPKRKILNHYVRKWQLNASRIQKLTSYASWDESEKLFFDQVMLKRLEILYEKSLDEGIFGEKPPPPAPSPAAGEKKPDRIILENKAKSILGATRKGRIRPSSLFLRLRPHSHLLLEELQNPAQWRILSGTDAQRQEIFSSPYLFETIGWAMANAIYTPRTSQLEMASGKKFFDAMGRPAGLENIHLALQPWPALSEEVFLSAPSCERIVVLLSINPKATKDEALFLAELLSKNSWGEISFTSVHLDKVDTLKNKCYHVCENILALHDNPPPYTILQLGITPVPQLIQDIKSLIEDARFLKNGSHETDLRRRARIDIL